jgi:hypothetical protein
MDRILEFGAVAATGAALRRVPIPGVARFAVTPLILRIARNRRARNILLGLAAVGLVATLLSDYKARDEADEWDEPY